MKDLLGNEVTPVEAHRQMGRKCPVPRGYAAPPGTGPTGETCKSCVHIARIRMAKTYLKCELRRSSWTGGGGTDIRASAPACRHWESLISSKPKIAGKLLIIKGPVPILSSGETE